MSGVRIPVVVAVPRDLEETDLVPILDTARELANLIGQMRTAFEGGDEKGALRIARQVCGLDPWGRS